ncbi:UPF0764 protein C16orf89 homolog [Oppia nitens]|uniref:UPF0764 protein C16orf89 homolog n=1 Tax=Oppia nitens TaxID=1686743 RepID=UPI0023DB3F0C|nr:UPF0764 protein C16orf89 homolog [Oppia nitens]
MFYQSISYHIILINIMLSSYQTAITNSLPIDLSVTLSSTTIAAEDIDLLQKSIELIYKTFNFYDKHMYEVLIDGLYGLRVMSDQMSMLLHRMADSPPPKPGLTVLISTLKQMVQKSDEIISLALPTIAIKDLPYYLNIGVILEKGMFGQIPDYSRRVNRSTEYTHLLAQQLTPLNGNTSDNCISQLTVGCHLTDECWKIMTGLGYQKYQLSHEVLYLQIASKYNCHQEINSMIAKHNQQSLEKLFEIFCTNMLRECREMTGNNSTKTTDQLTGFYGDNMDLLMEDIAFCGLIGFKEFTIDNKQWLKLIINDRINNENGCYVINQNTSRRLRRQQSNDKHRRTKRREVILSDGCLPHKTSVGLAAISVYIRDIIWQSIY